MGFKNGMEDFSNYFSVWDKLTSAQQAEISENMILRNVKKDTIIHNGGLDCNGLFIVRSGQLRAYILSEEGREITLYRLFDMDICLFSASCVMRSVQFDIVIKAEKDTEFWVISAEVYKKIMEESAPVANYTNEIMASRFSEVMWLIEQVMWQSMDKRIAVFLLEEASVENSDTLNITHETIANHLGTHREVVTRMLRYFQKEDIVTLSRGTVEISDRKKLEDLIDS